MGKDKKLSLDEKLAMIDEEIRTLHHFFLSKSFSPLEIEKGAQPFLKAVKNNKRKEYLIKLAEVVLAIILLVMLVNYYPFYHFLITLARLVTVYLVLPFWNWQSTDQVCFIPNPYYVVPELTAEECEACETVESIPRLSKVSPDTINDDYLSRDAPFVITDATNDWPAVKALDIKGLAKLYTEHEIMRDYTGCQFSSNIRKTNHKLLIKLAASGDIQKYYAYWENCLSPAAKVLRQFYSRPYFFPPGTQLVETNWVFVAQDYKSKSMKPIPIEFDLVWFAQLRGTSKIRVVPRDECVGRCSEMKIVLQPGEIFVAPTKLWLLDFKQGSEHENVAIGQGGSYD